MNVLIGLALLPLGVGAGMVCLIKVHKEAAVPWGGVGLIGYVWAVIYLMSWAIPNYNPPVVSSLIVNALFPASIAMLLRYDRSQNRRYPVRVAVANAALLRFRQKARLARTNIGELALYQPNLLALPPDVVTAWQRLFSDNDVLQMAALKAATASPLSPNCLSKRRLERLENLVGNLKLPVAISQRHVDELELFSEPEPTNEISLDHLTQRMTADFAKIRSHLAHNNSSA